MMDCAEHKPRNRSYFSIRMQKEVWMLKKEEWTSIILAVAAYLIAMGIGFLIYPR